MRRHRWLIALLIVLVSGSALAQAGSSARGQEGGMLRITLSPAAGVVLLDPAHEFTPAILSIVQRHRLRIDLSVFEKFEKPGRLDRCEGRECV